MNKFIKLSVVALAGLTLTACGSNNGSKDSSSKSSSNSEKNVKVDKSNDKYYFKNGVANLQDITVKITKVKTFKPNEGGNSSDKNLIAFYYTVTNKTGVDVDSTTGWQAIFNAYQDNNKNRENKLEVGFTPDNKGTYTNHQLDKIKKGGTVEGLTAYNLSDLKTPVKLVATKGDDQTKLGEQVYKLK